MRTMEPNLKTNFFFVVVVFSLFVFHITSLLWSLFLLVFCIFCFLILRRFFLLLQHHRKAISLAIRLPFRLSCWLCAQHARACAHPYTHITEMIRSQSLQTTNIFTKLVGSDGDVSFLPICRSLLFVWLIRWNSNRLAVVVITRVCLFKHSM